MVLRTVEQAKFQISISANIEEDFSQLMPAQQSNAPVAEFNSTTYDFGNNHTEGKPVEHEFQLTNKGKSDLIIRKLKPSCGCTTVNPDKMVLKPGEKTQIKAQLRTNGYSGRQSKSITVITNDPKQPSITLRITGSVVKKEENKSLDKHLQWLEYHEHLYESLNMIEVYCF